MRTILSIGVLALLVVCGCGPTTPPPPPDDCPDDPDKAEPGRCGCGVADKDVDLDGIPDCEDTEPFDFWGPAPPVGARLQAFDALWKDYREHYAGFVTSKVDWDQLGTSLRPQVEAANTYGEFYRLIRSAFFELRDVHDVFFSSLVCNSGWVRQRAPKAYVNSLIAENTLGLCLTPLDDDTALIYKAASNNPLGLKPGDAIVGYDGKDLRHALAEMLRRPICGSQPTHPESNDHVLLQAAASNLHLHRTMQFRRHGSSEVESIDTDQVLNVPVRAYPLLCTSQLDVGVPRPQEDRAAFNTSPPIMWGKLPGTNIGYIYAFAWRGNADTLFLQAVQELWNTDGLIVDFRSNSGGNMFLAFPALQELFDQNITGVFAVAKRTNTTDPYAMTTLTSSYEVTVNAKAYAHPIAVLTGPGAGSSGDIVGIYLASHPRARRFGRPSAGSACSNADAKLWDSDPYLFDLTVYRTTCIGLGPGQRPVAEGAVNPEQRVWLTADDVATGRDTVVEAARAWVETQ